MNRGLEPLLHRLSQMTRRKQRHHYSSAGDTYDLNAKRQYPRQLTTCRKAAGRDTAGRETAECEPEQKGRHQQVENALQEPGTNLGCDRYLLFDGDQIRAHE